MTQDDPTAVRERGLRTATGVTAALAATAVVGTGAFALAAQASTERDATPAASTADDASQAQSRSQAEDQEPSQAQQQSSAPSRTDRGPMTSSSGS